MDFNARKYCEERGVVFTSDEPQTAAKSNNGDGGLPPGPRFMDWREVHVRTRLSRSTIDRLEARGDFPQRIQITERKVVWSAAEVEEWMKARPRRDV